MRPYARGMELRSWQTMPRSSWFSERYRPRAPNAHTIPPITRASGSHPDGSWPCSWSTLFELKVLPISTPRLRVRFSPQVRHRSPSWRRLYRLVSQLGNLCRAPHISSGSLSRWHRHVSQVSTGCIITTFIRNAHRRHNPDQPRTLK